MLRNVCWNLQTSLKLINQRNSITLLIKDFFSLLQNIYCTFDRKGVCRSVTDVQNEWKNVRGLHKTPNKQTNKSVTYGYNTLYDLIYPGFNVNDVQGINIQNEYANE